MSLRRLPKIDVTLLMFVLEPRERPVPLLNPTTTLVLHNGSPPDSKGVHADIFCAALRSPITLGRGAVKEELMERALV
jgi:hypothetical protein